MHIIVPQIDLITIAMVYSISLLITVSSQKHSYRALRETSSHTSAAVSHLLKKMLIYT